MPYNLSSGCTDLDNWKSEILSAIKISHLMNKAKGKALIQGERELIGCFFIFLHFLEKFYSSWHGYYGCD
ncbi:hypothetical protein GDO81_009921 [Engystomops pustulosus]|uniref:Uncharacterized protein n=1 Tax=Engystomops pustulosus TaxID=76066 RepID=A0AAV7BWH9_ENGPU|nr:hypothetical protein GDO81_009921 [Engystomops pustulosus]